MGGGRKSWPLSTPPLPASAQTEASAPSDVGRTEEQHPGEGTVASLEGSRPHCQFGHLKLSIAATFSFLWCWDKGAPGPVLPASSLVAWACTQALTSPPSLQVAWGPPCSAVTHTPKALGPYLFTDVTASWCYWGLELYLPCPLVSLPTSWDQPRPVTRPVSGGGLNISPRLQTCCGFSLNCTPGVKSSTPPLSPGGDGETAHCFPPCSVNMGIWRLPPSPAWSLVSPVSPTRLVSTGKDTGSFF